MRTNTQEELNRAGGFVHKDPFMKYMSGLLYHRRGSQWDGESDWLVTDRLREMLHESFGIEVSKHQIRTDAIGPLRDRDVLIASGTRGYKIPSCLADMQEFADHA